MSRSSSVSKLHLALAMLVLSACGGGGDSKGTIAGRVQFVPASAALPFQDTEPNDTVDQPQVIGDVAPGQTIELRGDIGATGDAFDAFSFRASERVRVSARLVFEASPTRRIQLAVYDPVSMRIAERAPDRRVTFEARGTFDLVVRAAQGFGAYGLQVRIEKAGDVVTREGWLGDFSVGDQLALRVAGAMKWTATSTEAQALVFQAPVGVSVRVQATAGEPAIEIEGDGLEHRIELAPLAQVEIAASSASARIARVRCEALPPAARALARVAPLELERDGWNAGSVEPLYGRMALEAMPGQALVRARGNADLGELLERRSCRVREVITGISTVVETDLSPALDEAERARTTLALTRSLGASARVEFAEQNLIRRALGGGPVTPTDPFFMFQWHYRLIKMPEAWGVYSGTNDVVVAVIDTGRRAHPDLDGNTVAGFDFISDSTMAADGDGRDSNETDVGDGVGPTPSSFHGTHVAGTIAALTNNTVGPNPYGVAGIASFPVGGVSRVKVKHLRVLGQGGGSDADIAVAIQYAAGFPIPGVGSAAPVEVINMSLGSPGSSLSVQAAINQAHNAGVTIFAAAGNNNSAVPFFPASFQNVVSVSAVDMNSVKAPYSNFNSTVDLCAPGGDTSVDLDNDGYADGVLSTLVDETTHNPIFAFYQGTSMACPHAAGAAALLLAQNANLAPSQVEAALANTAVDLGAPGRDNVYGAGLIDVYHALLSVNGSGPATSPIIDVAPSTLSFGTSETVLGLEVFNVGTGSMTVGAITDDAPWLTTVPHVSSTSSTNIDGIAVHVDRAPGGVPLADGDYMATITIPVLNSVLPDPSFATVTVSMTVAPVVVFPSVQIYVLALDANDYHTVAQAVVDPSVSLDYSISDLPRGEYLLVAGSDDDPPGPVEPNDQICGPEDTYCGGYPTLDELEAFFVADGNISGLDFVVGPTATTGTTTSGGHRAFRLVRH